MAEATTPEKTVFAPMLKLTAVRVNEPVAGSMEKKLPIKLTRLIENNSRFASKPLAPSLLLKDY